MNYKSTPFPRGDTGAQERSFRRISVGRVELSPVHTVTENGDKLSPNSRL